MTTKIKRTGRASSVPGGLAIAATVSMLITFIFSAIIAYMLNTEKITWVQAGYWIMAMLFVASFIGTKCALVTVKCQRFMISVMSGILYWGLLLCITALFFGGQFGAVGETAGVIAAGSGCAVLLFAPRSKNNRKRTGNAYC